MFLYHPAWLSLSRLGTSKYIVTQTTKLVRGISSNRFISSKVAVKSTVSLEKDETDDGEETPRRLTTSNNMVTEDDGDMIIRIKDIQPTTAPAPIPSTPPVLTWQPVRLQLQQLPNIYMKLSKIRLTGLIVITTAAGYAVAPIESLQLSTLLAVTVGTGLTSCAANTFNQLLEIPYDSQMSRTKQRPLVRKHVGELHALTFALVSATSGLTLLAMQVNPVTCTLGLANLILYAAVYTPLKRVSIANTWVGSVVGAIPPLMGYTAATCGIIDAGSLTLAAILYAWQFPHFNALSWQLKSEYSRAGYRMMCVTEPNLCRVTALRYSAAIVLLCSAAAPLTQLTAWSFALHSLPPNIYLVYLAYRFYRDSDSKSSRQLFRYSLLHLPILMILLLIDKKPVVKKIVVEDEAKT